MRVTPRQIADRRYEFVLHAVNAAASELQMLYACQLVFELVPSRRTIQDNTIDRLGNECRRMEPLERRQGLVSRYPAVETKVPSAPSGYMF